MLLLFTGGFRVSVTRASVLVRAGLIGVPLLRLTTNEVAEAAAHSFSPLADFGGYGGYLLSDWFAGADVFD